MKAKDMTLGTFLAMALFLSGCASFQRAVISTTSSIIYQASAEIETESDWKLFQAAIPGNLKLLESLLSVHPKDQDLLLSLVKGYTGLAFVVHETLHLEEQLRGRGEEVHKREAVAMYSRALEYGLRYFSLKGLTYEKLVTLLNDNEAFKKQLDARLRATNQRDQEAVVFTAQALASLVNLSRNDMAMVAQLPLAKSLFDWVCEKNPEINFGACAIFYGSYEAGRPVMMGGNPERGLAIFNAAMEKYPHNWLVTISFIQHYVIPLYRDDLYEEWKPKLEEWRVVFEKQRSWRPPLSNEAKQEEFAEARLRLYQALAIRRYEIIRQYDKEIF